MAAPTIYRSSDTGAPILTANAGSLVNVLRACLVDGYGATRATNTLTSSGVNVSNNDTVTVNGTVYTFKTALTPTAGEVLIGANAAASLTNLAAAMGAWGTAGTTYATGTTQQSVLQTTTLTATVLTMTAHVGGTGGNALTLAKSAVTLTVGGATFSGGSGSDTTASLGWGEPFTATNKGVFRAALGARHYLDVDDSAPNTTANGRNAQLRGYETMTAVATGTGLFPTVAQVTTCVTLKSTTADAVNRPWMLIGDAYGFMFFNTGTLTNPPTLATHRWNTYWSFGEIYAALTGDVYRTMLNFPSTTVGLIADAFALTHVATNGATTAANFSMPRTYTGVGTATWVGLVNNPYYGNPSGGSQTTFPNQVDGGLYMNAMDVWERGTAATAAASSGFGCRGRMRGPYQTLYALTPFNDQDTFTGVGDFAGRTFMIVLSTGYAQALAIETTDWGHSA